jgi:hypothetical protein
VPRQPQRFVERNADVTDKHAQFEIEIKPQIKDRAAREDRERWIREIEILRRISPIK